MVLVVIIITIDIFTVPNNKNILTGLGFDSLSVLVHELKWTLLFYYKYTLSKYDNWHHKISKHWESTIGT